MRAARPGGTRRRLVAAGIAAVLVAVGPSFVVAAAKKDKKSAQTDTEAVTEPTGPPGQTKKAASTDSTTTSTTVPDATTSTETTSTGDATTIDSSWFESDGGSTGWDWNGSLEPYDPATIDWSELDDTWLAGPTSLRDVVTQIGADHLWAAGYTGRGIDVAVIDTGIAPVAELTRTDVFVGPDLSFDGNVDELAGLDSYGHGTHMAGIIAGRSPHVELPDLKERGEYADLDDGEFIGVAPGAGIVSVKVADHKGAVDVSQVIAAIDWVVQHRNAGDLNIRVLNLSYNTDGMQPYELDPLAKAVENAWNHGIVVVVSAGNEGMTSFGLANPATNPRVIAVSAAQLHQTWGWVNPHWAPSGDGVRNPDVLAPGVSVMGLRVPGSRIDLEHPEGRVADDDRLFLGSGTSQSAAVVSGAAALLLDQRPDLTPDQVKALLTSTAIGTFQFEIIKGNGVVDLEAAMRAETPRIQQAFMPATGLGSLEAARGTDHVEVGGELLVGEYTVTGAEWDPVAWVAASESATAWTGADDWSGSTWSGSTWSGSTWSGSTWSGSTWSGSTWSGSTWSGSTWSGSTWSGSTWSGSTWSGSTWSGSTWSGSTWSDSTWS